MRNFFGELKKAFVLSISAIVFGAALMGATTTLLIEANATASENRYFHTENAVSTSEWVTSTSWHGVNGLKTTLAIEEGASYAKMTYNGVVNPTQTLTISSPSVYDGNGAKVAAGSAVVLTYTAVYDQSKSLSIVTGWNSANGYSHVSVAFTDDLTINGYNGKDNKTQKNSMAIMTNGTYAAWAYTVGLPSLDATTNFLNYGGGAQITLSSEGVLKYNSYKLAALTDSALYTGLGYDAEYASSLLTELARGAIMSVTVYSPNASSYVLNISGINGGSGWSNWTDLPLSSSYIVQKTTTLYKDRSYKASDVLDWYCMKRNETGADPSYMNGFYGTTTWADGSTYFQIGNVNPVSEPYFAAKSETYNIIAATAGSGATNLTQTFTFDVLPSYTVKFDANGTNVSTTYGLIDGDVVTAPKAVEKDGYSFVGWTDGTNLYAESTKINVEADATYTAVYLDFVCVGGASARLVEPYGIRFTSKFDTATMDTIAAYEGVSYVFGAKIITDNSTESVDISGDKDLLYTQDNYSCFNSALVEIRAENYTRVFHARPYIVITDSNGATITVNAQHEEKNGVADEGRSYAQIIAAAYEDLALYVETLQTTITNIYDEVMNSNTLLPFVSVVKVDAAGEETSCTADFVTELTAYFADKKAKIGDTVSVADAITVPTGFAIDTEKSVLSGSMTTRGLVLKIVLVEESL